MALSVRGRLNPTPLNDANSHTLSTPTETVAGDSIYIWASTDEVAAIDGAIPSIDSASAADGWETQSGWTREQGDSTNVRGTLFYLPSAQGGGADQLVINFPSGVSEPCAYIAIAVQDGGTPVVPTPLSSVGGTDSTSNTPPATGTIPENDYLSILFLALDANSATHNVTAPTNYGNKLEAEPASSTSNMVMAASMERLLAGADGPVTSITPGAITWSGGDQSISAHVAIPFEQHTETRRFYLSNVADTSPEISVASWVNDPTAADTPHQLREQPAGEHASFSRSESTSTTPWYVLLGRWVSPPVSAAGTVYGDWAVAAAMLAAAPSSGLVPFFTAFVTVGDTDVRRGVPFNASVSADFPTSGASEYTGGLGTGDGSAELQVGDRLVIDFGYIATNNVSTTRTGTLHYGGTTDPDLAAGATDYTRPAWIDLQMTPGVAFEEPVEPHDTLRLYMTSAPADQEPTVGPMSIWSATPSGASAAPRLLGNTPAGDPDDRGETETSPTSGFLTLVQQWVSGPAESDGELLLIDWQMTMAAFESDADAGMAWVLGAWIMRADGTKRTEIVGIAGGTEWPVGTTRADAVGRSILSNFLGAGGSQLPQDLFTGERLVIEIGHQAVNADTTPYTGTILYGGTATTDLASGDVDPNLDRPSWIDIPVSPGLTLAEPDYGVEGTAAANLGALTATAAGDRATAGTATVALGALTATAAGVRATDGSAAALLGALTATADGVRATTGAAAALLGALTASAAGVPSRPGTAAALLGALTATAAGDREIAAAASALLGGLVASAEGGTSATADADLGALTATAAGTRVAAGLAAAVLGGLTAAASGLVTVEGLAAANLGPLTAAAVGDRDVYASAAAVLGALTASARQDLPKGAAAALLGALSATAAGDRSAAGHALAVLGGLVATADGTVDRHAAAAANLGPLIAAVATSGQEPGRFFLAY